ncbi:hypothetical protein A5682_17140 [Mycobacterium mantenii]|uniref:DUF2510 domain-containing protein n=1 Tax=Mycobacterium mantenii TaxID=560555 RepID=UPI000800DFF5|nr:DUF2510 domain-containing protein [Mycobacterium mantenii]OBH79413.1 hypothetical protein A5682_17140 [Mycobacterium mantenii]
MPSEQAPLPPKSAPGWYPDPAGIGHGLQRYFDGTSWTSEWAFSAEPPKKGLSAKAILAVASLCVLVLLVVVGKSWIFDPTKNGQSSSSSSSATAAAPAPSEAAPAGPKKPDGVTFTTAPGPNGDVVDARFAIRDNYTEQLIRDGARLDTIGILKYARATYPDAAAVNVQGTFPMTDPYGNTSTQVAIDLTYSRATLDKINFDGISKASIWEIRDSGNVLPAFQP